MEHSNLHSQHQLQDQVVNAPTSSLPALLPSTSSTANKYSNSSNIILNSTSTGNDVRNDHQLIISEAIPNSNSRAWYSPHDHQDYFMSYRNDDITRSCFTQLQYNYSPNQQLLLPLSNIKEEISSDFFSKLMSEKLSNPLEVADRLNHHLSPNSCKQDINIIPPCDMVDNIWLNNNNSISSAGFQKYFSAGEAAYSNATTAGPTFGGFEGVAEFNLRYDLSDTFPLVSTNYKGVSDPLSSSLGFNFQGLDLLSSTQSSSHVNNLGLYEPSGSLGHDHHHDVQGSKDTPSSNTSNITSAFKSELVSRTKRPSSSRSGNFSEPKASQSAAKKSRPVLRSSNPPLKIRKEKLGDRIAALHRLVAPFGKTDTASVLTEAIGYIQFLQDQVQTMSVPYMKSLQSKPSRKMQQQGLSKEEEKETTKRELRSRGLCLVPTSCVSYISGYDD